MTGHNLGASALAIREMKAMRSHLPGWLRVMRPLLNGVRRTEKILDGAYGQKWPLEYRLFGAEGTRVSRVSARASFRWP